MKNLAGLVKSGAMHQSNPPVCGVDSRILILGSFPSVKSREAAFYYANPQNRFWRTLAQIFGQPISAETAEKIRFLMHNGIALWDMVESCQVEGSMDSDLKNITLVDLHPLLDTHDIREIFINGQKAYALFLSRYREIGIPYRVLPSTSPANASFLARGGFDAWQKALAPYVKSNGAHLPSEK